MPAFIMKARVHIWVEGEVQGVGFRFECQRMASRLGLRGWVKNLADGRVEIIAEGEQDAVNQLVRWSRRGPFGAGVAACQATAEPPTDEFEAFDIRF